MLHMCVISLKRSVTAAQEFHVVIAPPQMKKLRKGPFEVTNPVNGKPRTLALPVQPAKVFVLGFEVGKAKFDPRN